MLVSRLLTLIFRYPQLNCDVCCFLLQAQVDQIEVGDECGIGLAEFEDFQPGDVIESFVVQKK